jgi:TetR/AcrR family transcriptional regulator, transcriptional repressor for nem operon
MNSRKHRPSDTSSQIIHVARDLFHRKGLRCTTADEIIEAAGIAKAEFHQHFKNKPELAGALLRYYFEGLAAGIGPVKYELDSWDDLQECLRSHIEFQKKFKMTRSCPIGTLGGELREGDDLTRQALSLILDLMLARLESFFSREKMAGRLASNADVEQMANFCVAVIQGAMLLGRIGRDCRRVEVVFEDLLSHLNRYAKVPTATRKRLGRDRHDNHLLTLPKAQAPTTVVGLHDSQNPEDSAEKPS